MNVYTRQLNALILIRLAGGSLSHSLKLEQIAMMLKVKDIIYYLMRLITIHYEGKRKNLTLI